MTCTDIALWVDAEGADDLPAPLRAHGDTCPRCAALLRAERAIHAGLTATPEDMPPDLDVRILERVARDIRRERAALVARPRVPSVWESLSTAPPLAGALVLAVALMIWGDALWRSLARVNVTPIARLLASHSGGVPVGAWCACLILWPLAALFAWELTRARPRGT